MDEAKNMALLFFIDHLMLKNGRRTVHDLSCQFGARGFTEEMREAVGTTQEGLTEFLSKYPSLFKLDGDQVILQGYDGETETQNHLLSNRGSGRQRNYVEEAVKFFVAKLEKFGPELQIKSLLGHRSQASPEIRIVSGRHMREFAEFLSRQHEYFVVEGERVRLKNMPEPKTESQELDEDGTPFTGIKAKLKAMDFLKGLLEQNNDTSVPLEAFYKQFCERFSHSFRQEVATNPKELLMFLKQNRNVFFIRSNKVSLVKSRPNDENSSESGRSTEDSCCTGKSSLPSTIHNGGNSLEISFLPSILSRENIDVIKLASGLKSAQEIVRDIKNDLSAQSPQKKFIATDFKLLNLGDDFLVMIIVSTQNNIACFDLAYSESIFLESGLKNILEDSSIVKVVHDVKRVSTLLAQHYAVNMQNVFDTQIAHSIIQSERLNKPFNEIRPISFLNLQRVYTVQSLIQTRPVSTTFKKPNLLQRPITDELLLNSCDECHSLAVAIYSAIAEQFPPKSRKDFELKCLEALTPNPSKPPPIICPAPTKQTETNGFHRTTPLKMHFTMNFGEEIQNEHPINGTPINMKSAAPFSFQNHQHSSPASTYNPLINTPYKTAIEQQRNDLCRMSQTNPTQIPSGPFLPPTTNGCFLVQQQQQPSQQIIPIVMKPPPKKTVTTSTQTFSTGEIKMLNTYDE